jgi:Trk K+ transport system NAD-binding subunit
MKTGGLIGKELKEIAFEEGCLVAIIHRDGKAFVPKGSTVIREGDRLVVIGEPSGIKTLKEKYCTSF